MAALLRRRSSVRRLGWAPHANPAIAQLPSVHWGCKWHIPPSRRPTGEAFRGVKAQFPRLVYTAPPLYRRSTRIQT
jgi:hypothetical protein